MLVPTMPGVGHIAFSASLVFLVSRYEADQRKRERIEDKTWDLLLATWQRLERKPRRRRGRTKQIPLFPLDHQIRLKFQPLPPAATRSPRSRATQTAI